MGGAHVGANGTVKAQCVGNRTRGRGVTCTRTNPTLNMHAEEILVPLIVFATIFGIVYIAVVSRHRQRMAMIEKGADPSLFASKSNGSVALAIGLLMAGLGAGLAIGWFIDRVFINDPTSDNPLPYFIPVLICGGLALLQYHRIIRHRQQG